MLKVLHRLLTSTYWDISKKPSTDINREIFYERDRVAYHKYDLLRSAWTSLYKNGTILVFNYLSTLYSNMIYKPYCEIRKLNILGAIYSFVYNSTVTNLIDFTATSYKLGSLIFTCSSAALTSVIEISGSKLFNYKPVISSLPEVDITSSSKFLRNLQKKDPDRHKIRKAESNFALAKNILFYTSLPSFIDIGSYTRKFRSDFAKAWGNNIRNFGTESVEVISDWTSCALNVPIKLIEALCNFIYMMTAIVKTVGSFAEAGLYMLAGLALATLMSPTLLFYPEEGIYQVIKKASTDSHYALGEAVTHIGEIGKNLLNSGICIYEAVVSNLIIGSISAIKRLSMSIAYNLSSVLVETTKASFTFLCEIAGNSWTSFIVSASYSAYLALFGTSSTLDYMSECLRSVRVGLEDRIGIPVSKHNSCGEVTQTATQIDSAVSATGSLNKN